MIWSLVGGKIKKKCHKCVIMCQWPSTRLYRPQLNVTFHHSTVRKGPNNLFRRAIVRKPLLSKMNIAAQAQLTKLHLHKGFCSDVFWTDQSKVELFGHVWSTCTFILLYLIVSHWPTDVKLLKSELIPQHVMLYECSDKI